MTKLASKPPPNMWRRRFYLVIAAWLLTGFAMSFSPVRGTFAYPLYVHQAEASGEAAYVMADGPAYWERLQAASDLYHRDRVNRIIVLKENEPIGWNFVQKKTDTRFDRTLDYLAFFGVPSECVSSVPQDEDTWLGSLSEARGLAEHYPDLESLVVVTSAPHTRRSLLCFNRSLPDQVELQVYAASIPEESSEIHDPIWIEYVKLFVYFVVA